MPVSVASQLLEAPRLSHWNASIQIVRYLKRVLGQEIFFKRNGHLRVEGFSHANWARSLQIEGPQRDIAYS